MLNVTSSEGQSFKVQINRQLLKERWPAQWISCPGVSLADYGVYHFRRVFNLSTKPEQFIIHISAPPRFIQCIKCKTRRAIFKNHFLSQIVIKYNTNELF